MNAAHTPDRERAIYMVESVLMGGVVSPIDYVKVSTHDQRIRVVLNQEPFPNLEQHIVDTFTKNGMAIIRKQQYSGVGLNNQTNLPLAPIFKRTCELIYWFEWTI